MFHCSAETEEAPRIKEIIEASKTGMKSLPTMFKITNFTP
jgi:hypothetical protein